MTKHLLVFIIAFCTIGLVKGQINLGSIDNIENKFSIQILKTKLHNAKTNLEKAQASNTLAEFYNNRFEWLNTDSARFYARKSLEICGAEITQMEPDLIDEYLGAKQILIFADFRDGSPKDSLRGLIFQILKLSLEVESRRNQADCYNNLALLSNSADSMYYYFQQSNSTAKEIQLHRVLAYSNGNLANFYRMSRSYNKARKYFKGAFENYKIQGSLSGCAQIMGALGRVLFQVGKTDSAELYFSKSLEVLRKIGFEHAEAQEYLSTAQVCVNQINYSKAIAYLEMADSILKKLDDPVSLLNANSMLAYIYGVQANYPAALQCYLNNLAISRDLGLKQNEQFLLLMLGQLYVNLRQYELAEKYLLKSISLNKSVQGKAIVVNAYYSLSTLYQKQRKLHKLESIQDSIKNIRITPDVDIVTYRLLLFDIEGKLQRLNGNHQLSVSLSDSVLVLAKELNSLGQGTLFLAEALLSYVKDSLVNTKINYRGRLIDKDEALEEAISNFEFGIHASDIGLEMKQNYTNLLSDAYGIQGNYHLAFKYSKIHKALFDSIYSLDREMEIQNIERSQNQLKDSLATEKKLIIKEQEHKQEIAKKENQRNLLLFGGLAILLVAGTLFSRLRLAHKAKKVIEKERNEADLQRARSDELLLNILPAEVAEELKNTGESEAKHFDEVSILFTDFKGFTQASEKLNAKDLVNEINTCFKAFDNICEKYGIEKIKTIGDSYMAASGLGRGLRDKVQSLKDASNMVSAALEMQHFMTTLNFKPVTHVPSNSGINFEMRAGIHTGPVVAGIVGVKKFQYDIWGDTVNTASRMESAGEIGKLNISQATYKRVKADPNFAFESRGMINAKGKGDMQMFFVSLNS